MKNCKLASIGACPTVMFTSPELQKTLQVLKAKKPLPLEEELELGKIIKAGGKDATAARTKLMQHNYRLVVTILKRLEIPIDEQLDAFMAAISKMWENIDKYDPEMGLRFMSYAMWHAKDGIMNFLNNEGSTMRLGDKRTISLVKKFIDMDSREEEPLTAEKFAEAMGISLSKASEVEKLAYSSTQAFSSTGFSNCSIGRREEFDENTSNLFNVQEDIDESSATIEVVTNYFLSKLTEREKTAWSLRHLSEGYHEMPFEMIGAIMGTSADSARKANNIAEAKIAKARKGMGRAEFLEQFGLAA